MIVMIKRELESNKRFTATMIQAYQQQKNFLEQTEDVKYYLETSQSLTKEQKFQEFLNQLEIGEDGTVFSPYDEYRDKAHQHSHFGLTRSFDFAIDLIRKNKREEVSELDDQFYILTFEEFQLYLDNARAVLTDMNYVDGDRLFDNQYDYVIHQNPKNYSVVDFGSLLPLTKKDLEQNYGIFNVWITLEGGIAFAIEYEKFDSLFILENLTPREREAFYGDKAKQILGLMSKREKKRERVRVGNKNN